MIKKEYEMGNNMSENKFRMPGEFEPHDGCLMIWPERPGSWKDGVEAEKAFTAVAKAIAQSETVYMMVSPEKLVHAKKVVTGDLADRNIVNYSADNIVFIPFSADDSWARDTGPTFVVSKTETNGNTSDKNCACRERRGIDWGFNAWGGSYDGLYAHYNNDALVAGKLCEFLGNCRIDMTDFILEGGSIHADGEGTLITTEECLLSPGRNQGLTKAEIENKLKSALAVEKIVWLPKGVDGDETNGHVDNFCCFSAPGEVLLAWSDDPEDPNYENCRKAYEILSNECDARGRSFNIRKLPFPKEPVVLTEKDLEGYVFEEGEDTREVGERLAASYVNFYISNGAVVYPMFGSKQAGTSTANVESDEYAAKVLAQAFPNREIIGIDARVILLGGGNIHCITQQIPKTN